MFTLKTLIIREKLAARPARAFRSRLWHTLDAALPPLTRSESRHIFFKKAAVGFAIVVPCLLGGTSAYAYSSPTVTEGNVLYPVRRGIETMQIRFAHSPEEEAALHMRMYERRLDEAERLLEMHTLMIETLNAAADEDAAVNSVATAEALDAMMREKFAQDLQRMQARYQTVRLRVHIVEPSEASSLRDPSFMMRKTQDHE